MVCFWGGGGGGSGRVMVGGGVTRQGNGLHGQTASGGQFFCLDSVN